MILMIAVSTDADALARVRLVRDLVDAVGVEVDDGAPAVDHNPAVAGPIRDRRRSDVVGQHLALDGVSGDRDAWGAAHGHIAQRGGETARRLAGRAQCRRPRGTVDALELVLGVT